MPRTFFLSFPSPNSTKKRSSSISDICIPLFSFRMILKFFLKVSRLILLCDRTFRMAQFFPRFIATLVLRLPSSTSSAYSSVKDSFFHSSSSSSAIILLTSYHPKVGKLHYPQNKHNNDLTLGRSSQPNSHNSCKTCTCIYKP